MIINNENKKIINFKDDHLKAKDNSSQSNEDISINREASEKETRSCLI